MSLPSGFGTDYAGVVDQLGDGVTEFAAGDRVFGGALPRAVADYVVVTWPGRSRWAATRTTPPTAPMTAPPPVAAGQLRVPIAASFPIEQIRAAVELHAERHVQGKVVIELNGER